MKIGEKLRKVRQLRDLSQDFLGREIGLDQNAISRFENNKTAPDLIQLQKIAYVLHINLKNLLLFDEEKTLNGIDPFQTKDCNQCIWRISQMKNPEPCVNQKMKNRQLTICFETNGAHTLFRNGAEINNNGLSKNV